MKKVLYIDRAFKTAFGGDKNRSRYLYKALQQEYIVDFCMVAPQSGDDREEASLQLHTCKDKASFMPDSIVSFDTKEKKLFASYIEANGIDILFFRTIAFSELAYFIAERYPKIKIIVDSDLLLSRLMEQAWQKNRSIKSRFYLIQALKLARYEAKLYQQNFTFLLTNETEVLDARETHPHAKVEYLQNTTDLQIKSVDIGPDKNVVFYGAMDSTANIEGYNYIHDQLYPLIEDALKKHDIEILIVGKGCDKLKASTHERIKIVGKVDSISETILSSRFVLLPIFIASGTNTRVIEAAMSGRATLTTPLAMEGLSREENLEYVVRSPQEMAERFIEMLEDKTYTKALAQTLQEEIVRTFAFDNFAKKLHHLMARHDKCRTKLIHVPRRFTEKAWGGTETVVYNSAVNVEPFGYNSTIITTKALDSKPVSWIGEVQVRRYDYFYPYFAMSEAQVKSFDAIGGNLFSWSLLWALLRDKGSDIIHLHTLKRMGAIARTVAKFKKIPYVITLHGGLYHVDEGESAHRQEMIDQGFEWGKILGALFGSRKVLDEAAAIITLSDEEYAKAKEIHGDKVHYLRNGVDVPKFANGEGFRFRTHYHIDSDKKLILCSGRIDTQKNQLLLLESFAKLQAERGDLHLALLGAISDETYMQALEASIVEKGIKDQVTFIADLTPKDQLLVDAYHAADLLVLPSRHEPFGMVILEAFAALTPVIASATGGIVKIIEDNENGLLFENGNAEALYGSMKRLFEDEARTKQLVEMAYISVMKYDWREIAKELDLIYQNAILTQRDL